MLICMDTQVSEPSDLEVSWAVDTLKMLADPTRLRIVWALLHGEHSVSRLAEHVDAQPAAGSQDRKSTRLNSSHTVRSYAVFCLKKKTTWPTAGTALRPPGRRGRSAWPAPP